MFFFLFKAVCRPLYCSDLMWVSDMHCITYYKEAGPFSYEIIFRLLPKSGNIPVTKFDEVMNRIGLKLKGNTPSKFHLCKSDMFLKLNITLDQASQQTGLPPAVGSWLDVHVAFYSDDFQSNINYNINAIRAVLNIDFVEMDNYSMVHIVEESDINTTLHRRVIPWMPGSNYVVNEDNLISLKFSPLFNSNCISPARINFLQNCSKVILENDTFRGEIGNTTNSIFVLGQIVERNEVMAVTNGKKIVMCAEKYFQLVKSRKIDTISESVFDNSKSQKVHVSIISMLLAVFVGWVIVKNLSRAI